MPPIFQPAADTRLRLVLLAAAVGVVGVLVLLFAMVRSDYWTREEFVVAQPVQFTHSHHAGTMGIDCRYCHTSVEDSDTAGYPAIDICMTCHSQVFTDEPMLAPVRRALAEERAIRWNRVYDLPDFVYFRHDIHVEQGVGCVQCHGRVDRMPLVRQETRMQMQFCLDCHRDPAPRLRPREAVFDMDWNPPANRRELGERLIEEYGIAVGSLTHCYICHR